MRKFHFLLLLSFLFSTIPTYAQNICDVYMEPVCSSDTFDAAIPDLDIYEYVEICNGESYLMLDVAFYHVRIQEAGTFTFLIHKDPQDDYDFAVWQNPDCTDLGMPDRASFLADNYFNISTTGLALNEQGTCESAGFGVGNIYEPGLVRHLDVEQGDEIIIMIYRPLDPITGEQPGDFSVSFGGDAALDCTIVGNSYGKCDVDGNNQESFVQADFLTDLNSDFPGHNFEFYTNSDDAENGTGTQVAFPYVVNLANNPSEIFVRIENATGGFVRVLQLFLYVNEIPQITSPVTLSPECDLDGDGESEFDLTLAELNLVSSPELYNFKYYESETAANTGANNFINNPTNYSSGNGTVYVRVETGVVDGNEEGCFVVGAIHLELIEPIIPEFNLEEQYCQHVAPINLPNLSENGITGNWNVSQINTTILGNLTYTFTPDTNQCAEIFSIEIEIVEGITPEFSLQPAFCVGETAPDLPEISDNGIEGTWFPATIDTTNPGVTTYEFTPLDANCTVNYSIELEIVDIAELNNGLEIEICDNNFDGFFGYNLMNLNEELVNSVAGLTFSYYASLENLQDEVPIPQNQWNNYNLNLPASVWVVAENSQNCRSQAVEVRFIEGQEVQHNPNTLDPIRYCEGEPMDLTIFENDMAQENGISFTYYKTLASAQNETNPITNETAYTPDSNDGIIYVKLEKADRCSVILNFEFTLQTAPVIENLPSQITLCEGQEIIDLEVSSDDPNATYVWTWGENQTQTGATISIASVGIYTLTVTGENGCVTSETMLVESAGQPIIQSVESGPDYLIVTAQPGGSGGLIEYSLNQILWQNSPRFDNLIKGQTYTIYVREGGCTITSYQAVILDVPNFISPNGDGYNDQWSIRGIEVTPTSTIKIFDRYGKIFVDTNFEGNYIWDGKYLGRPLSTGDYWYILEVPSDGIMVAQKFVGHISIKNGE